MATTRRPTLLIVGCGDVGQRVLRQLAGRWRVKLPPLSILKKAMELCSWSAWELSSSAVEAISSEALAFCCVALDSWPIAPPIWLTDWLCSCEAALISLRGLAGVYEDDYLPLFGEHQASNAAVALALVDVLQKANWVKRVLFLADRTALVNQAANAQIVLPAAYAHNTHIWNQFTLRVLGTGQRDALRAVTVEAVPGKDRRAVLAAE